MWICSGRAEYCVIQVPTKSYIKMKSASTVPGAVSISRYVHCTQHELDDTIGNRLTRSHGGSTHCLAGRHRGTEIDILLLIDPCDPIAHAHVLLCATTCVTSFQPRYSVLLVTTRQVAMCAFSAGWRCTLFAKLLSQCFHCVYDNKQHAIYCSGDLRINCKCETFSWQYYFNVL